MFWLQLHDLDTYWVLSVKEGRVLSSNGEAHLLLKTILFCFFIKWKGLLSAYPPPHTHTRTEPPCRGVLSQLRSLLPTRPQDSQQPPRIECHGGSIKKKTYALFPGFIDGFLWAQFCLMKMSRLFYLLFKNTPSQPCWHILFYTDM